MVQCEALDSITTAPQGKKRQKEMIWTQTTDTPEGRLYEDVYKERRYYVGTKERGCQQNFPSWISQGTHPAAV